MARALLRASEAAWATGGVTSAEFWGFDKGQYHSISEEGGAYTLTDVVSVGNTSSENWTWALPVIFNVAGGATLNLGTALPIAGTGSWAGLQTFSGGATVAGSSALHLNSGSELGLASGSSLVFYGTGAVTGTATWAGLQTFSAGISCSSIGIGGVTIHGLIASYPLSQATGLYTVTSTSSFEDITGSTLSLGTRTAGEIIVIDLGPLSDVSVTPSGTATLRVVLTEDGSDQILVDQLCGASWHAAASAVYTCATGGAVSIRLQGKLLGGGATGMNVTTTTGGVFWRCLVYR